MQLKCDMINVVTTDFASVSQLLFSLHLSLASARLITGNLHGCLENKI